MPSSEQDELEALIVEARRRERRRRAGYAALLAVAAVLAGGLYVAFSQSGGREAARTAVPPAHLSLSQRTGVLTGTIRAPVPPGGWYVKWPGLVIVFRPSGRVVAREDLRTAGLRFRFVLPAGRYLVNVRSERGDGCRARNAFVRGGRTTHLTIGILCTAD